MARRLAHILETIPIENTRNVAQSARVSSVASLVALREALVLRYENAFVLVYIFIQQRHYNVCLFGAAQIARDTPSSTREMTFATFNAIINAHRFDRIIVASALQRQGHE